MFKIIYIPILIIAYFLFPIGNTYSSNVKPDKIKIDSTKEYYIINSIEISGNKITKRIIMTRELLFKENDTIKKELIGQLLDKSKDNLLNTYLFNFVTIDFTPTFPEKPTSIPTVEGNRPFQFINIKIDVIERWYTLPIPQFGNSQRNFTSWWQTKAVGNMDYGINLIQQNVRGMKETAVLTLREGYDQIYNLTYINPNINKKETIGLALSGGYNRNSTVGYATVDDLPAYYKNIKHDPLVKYFGGFRIFSRPNMYDINSVDINYYHLRFSDTLNSLNKNFSLNNKTNVQYMTLHYKFTRELRDSKTCPLTGHYFTFEVYNYGIFNSTSSPYLMNIHSTYSDYIQLSKKFYLSGGLIGSYNDTYKEPYYLATAIGYGHDNIRGYDIDVINGQFFGVGKVNFIYNLVPRKTYDIKFIPNKRFGKIYFADYAYVFADCGYVYDNNFYTGNSLANQLLYSYGAGVDFFTYYNKMFRIEYTFTKQSPKGGLFFNFITQL